MRGQIRFSIRVLLAAALMAAASAIGGGTAHAQIMWNPPCANAMVVNMTGCPVTFTLWATPANIGPITVPFCCGVNLVPIPAGTTINGVVTQAGALIGMAAPAPVVPAATCGGFAPLPTAPANAIVRRVTLGPAPGCCFDVFFYHNSDPMYPCHIFLNAGTPAPPPPCIP